MPLATQALSSMDSLVECMLLGVSRKQTRFGLDSSQPSQWLCEGSFWQLQYDRYTFHQTAIDETLR